MTVDSPNFVRIGQRRAGRGRTAAEQVPAMNALTKWVPRLIDGLAVVHLAYGMVAPEMAGALGGIAANGVVNTVAGHPERGLWQWYVATGVALLGLGELARWTARETGRLPARLGAWLLAVAVPIVLLEPASGGWLVAALGLLALRAGRTEAAAVPADGMPTSPATRSAA